MVSKAIARFARLSPRKARVVVNLVRGRQAGEALQRRAGLRADRDIKRRLTVRTRKAIGIRTIRSAAVFLILKGVQRKIYKSGPWHLFSAQE